MSTIIESVRSAIAGRQQQRLAGYTELVGAVANGRDVDPAESARILEAAGKGVEDLDADVSALSDVRRINAELRKRPDVEAELARIQAEQEADARDRTEAERQFQIRSQERHWQAMQLSAQLTNLRAIAGKRSARGMELAEALDGG